MSYFIDKIMLFFLGRKTFILDFSEKQKQNCFLGNKFMFIENMNKQEKLEQTSHNPGSPTILYSYFNNNWIETPKLLSK